MGCVERTLDDWGLGSISKVTFRKVKFLLPPNINPFLILLLSITASALEIHYEAAIVIHPIVGQYAYRLGCVPVNRGKGAAAIRKMVADVASGRVAPGQLVIYPQGTRVAPGAKRIYKMGSGVFVPRIAARLRSCGFEHWHLLAKTQRVAQGGDCNCRVYGAHPKGKPVAEFMELMEQAVEVRSRELMPRSAFTSDTGG